MHQRNRILFGIPLVIAGALIGTSCKTRQSRSETESVEVRQAPVKNKMQAGFRWIYATTDFLESEYRKKAGGQLNLSEEALGFHRITEYLLQLIKKKADAAAIVAEIGCQQFHGLHAIRAGEQSGSENLTGLELAERYGVIPEEVYGDKFVSEDQREGTFWGIRERMKILLAEKPAAQITREDIESRVIIRPAGSATRASGFKAVPPSSYSFQGKTWTPRDFYLRHLKIAPSDYVNFSFKSEADYPKLVMLVKKTLAAGISVPFEFGVDRSHLMQEDGATVFSGKVSDGGPRQPADPDPAKTGNRSDSACPPKVTGEFAQGMHAVLITDFVNKGSKEGAFESQQKLAREVAKSPDQLQYLKIKNTWGFDEDGTEDGTAWLSAKDGHYRVDREYLIGHLRQRIGLRVSIPRSIVEGK